MNADLFTISGLIYLAAMVLYLFEHYSGHKRFGVAASIVMVVGALCTLTAFLLRYQYYYKAMEGNLLLSFPVSNMFESIHFSIFCVVVIFPIFSFNTASRSAGSVIAAMAGIGILATSIAGISSNPAFFVPALKSYWLIAHVLLSFLAYACFALSAVLGLLILANNANLAKCEQYTQQIKVLVSVGMVLFTIGGLIFGAIWAKNTWGRFWSWDPKETWAFITWCVYLVFIHFFKKSTLSYRSIALFALFGFLIVIFTFLGVNILLIGLHSYGAA